MPVLIHSRKTTDSDIAVAIDAGVSQSEFGTYDLCRYRWYLEKVKMLTSLKPEFVLTVGTAFHTGMDWMYKSKGERVGIPPLQFNKLAKLTPEEEEEAVYWQKVLEVLIKAYRKHYADDFIDPKIISLEQVLKVGIEGINLCGALDLADVHNKATRITDHKTKGMKGGRGSSIDEWKTRFQFLLYTLMWNLLYPDQKVRYFMANVIHKPALSVKNGETRTGFYIRLQQDIAARRADYFKRESIPVTSDILKNFYTSFLFPRIQNFKILQTVKPNTREYDALVLHRNSASCWAFGRQCPFYAHCHNGKKLEELPHLTTRRLKHEHYEEKAD